MTIEAPAARDSREMTVDQEEIVERVAKILRLAARNTNEHEAAAATAKAQEMLAAYNLDLATVERKAAGAGSSERGKREDSATAGGQYQYQRDLWKAVAKLNFCLYFTTEQRKIRSKRTRTWDGTLVERATYFYQKQHRIVGRVVNTTMTRTMSAYLEGTIERLCRERYPHQSQFFSRSAVSYREGMAESVVERLHDRRNANLRADAERREAEAARRAAAGIASDTALSLQVYQDEETDANMDVIKGEGWSARQAERRARAAAEMARAEREQAAYDAANPEEAAARRKKEEAEVRAWSKRYARRGYGGPGSRGGSLGKPRDEQAYYAGYEKGESIGIDPQAEHGAGKTRRIA